MIIRCLDPWGNSTLTGSYTLCVWCCLLSSIGPSTQKSANRTNSETFDASNNFVFGDPFE